MKDFVLKAEYSELINMLTDTQAGVLFKAVMEYASSGCVEAGNQIAMNESDTSVKILFEVIRRDIDNQEEG